ncbi:hypothetical protein BpHYR1_032606 [Brachionus plicatilis]|uniref:Uncharacterized protein n=1 Tax=Brachionus plicatilis TaxID=10195 RepID=A0A3M7QYQ0_BRAPC|nr:hypothetical protein BpHYR1_032606 [Brachionus plicatilis]
MLFLCKILRNFNIPKKFLDLLLNPYQALHHFNFIFMENLIQFMKQKHSKIFFKSSVRCLSSKNRKIKIIPLNIRENYYLSGLNNTLGSKSSEQS